MWKLGAFRFPLLIIVAWIMVFITRLIPVGGEWVGLDAFTWLTIFIWTVVYFTAMFLGVTSSVNTSFNLNSWPSKWQNRWIIRLSFFSMLGAILIIYEFAVIRAYGFSTPVSIIRQMEVAVASDGFEGSWISGAGRMLTPALMVAWVLSALNWAELRKNTLIILSLSSSIVFYQQMMFEGGRFFLAALLVMIFLARGFANRLGLQKSVSIINRMFWIGLFIVVCLLFGYMFIDRYSQTDRIFSEAYETWAANFDLEVDDKVSSRLSGSMSGVWLALCMIWAYFTQGINELNSLLLSSPPQPAWGGFQFSQIAQVLNKITSLDLKYDQLQNLPKIGTYNTLYGASYIDFGHIGALIFIAAIGWITGKAIRFLQSQRLNGLAINAPLLITLGVFAPIVSLVVNLWPAFCWALLVGSVLKLPTHQISPKPTLVSKKYHQ